MDEIKSSSEIIDDYSDSSKKPKKKNIQANKTPLLIGGLIALLIFIVMAFVTLSNGEKGSKNKNTVKGKEVLAQEQQILKEKAYQEKAFAGIQDNVLENADVMKDVGKKSENEKYGDLLKYLKTNPDELVSENVIGQEEYNPDPRESLSSAVNQSNNVPNRERAIYRTGNEVDPKYQKEDYEAEKQSFFAYSTSYKGASYYAGAQTKESGKASIKSDSANAGEAADQDEFAGKSEEEIVKTLTTKYTNEAAGLLGKQTGKTPLKKTNTGELPAIPIIYNNLAPVKCYQGQFLDGVLLHKLIADTEEAPVVVAVSKDFFDATAQYVAIPSGTRVIGRSQVVSYQGAARLYVWFDRLILPNGVSVPLPQSGNGLDLQGSLGIVSDVNRHFWQKYGSALFVGLLDGLSGLAQSNTSDAQMQYMFGRSSQNFGEINKEMMRSNGNIVPTISVNAGHKIKINLADDIIISAFSLISDRSYAGRAN
jgi:type IV secretory pathway VirB10-like protein